MELTLASNIKKFRKERKLTQEQLAEVLGVTTGAVYKWESGMSVPELNLIVEMADFFDTSVDVLLGYKMKDNRIEYAGKRLFEYIQQKNAEVLPEAEKLLKKYPNSFDVVYRAAQTYLFFASVSDDRHELDRALELYEQSLLLLPQNTDPAINDATIYSEIASVYSLKGDKEKSVQLLKDHNAGGLYNVIIGELLAVDLGRPEEAEKYLAQVLLQGFAKVFTLTVGYSVVFLERRDYASAEKILNWGINLTKDIKDQSKPDYCDKAFASIYVIKAYAEMMQKKHDDARESMKRAVEHAASFDANPLYTLDGFKVKIHKGGIGINDGAGATAKESLEMTLKKIDSKELYEMYDSIK